MDLERAFAASRTACPERRKLQRRRHRRRLPHRQRSLPKKRSNAEARRSSLEILDGAARVAALFIFKERFTECGRFAPARWLAARQRSQKRQMAPHPGWFFAKSAESLEKKRVEICASAKKCKRLRKNVKRKGIPRLCWGQVGDKG